MLDCGRHETRATRRRELLGISAVLVAYVHHCFECCVFIVTPTGGGDFDKNVTIPCLLKYINGR